MPKGHGGCVVGATRITSVVAVFGLLFKDIYGRKPIPLNILFTTHPKNQTYCHLPHQHALRNTCRLTFNRNVVKRLDFVLEWQKNPYSIDVAVTLHNVTYSRIWMLIKGWMCACSCVSRMVSIFKPSTDRRC